MLIAAAGPAALPDVWRRYTRPALWPGWAPQIRSAVTDAEVVAPGATGTVHGPLLLRAPFRILEVDHERHRWTWRVGVGPLAVVLEHGVDPVAPGGSRAWARVHAPALLAAPYSPLARLALRRLVA